MLNSYTFPSLCNQSPGAHRSALPHSQVVLHFPQPWVRSIPSTGAEHGVGGKVSPASQFFMLILCLCSVCLSVSISVLGLCSQCTLYLTHSQDHSLTAGDMAATPNVGRTSTPTNPLYSSFQQSLQEHLSAGDFEALIHLLPEISCMGTK